MLALQERLGVRSPRKRSSGKKLPAHLDLPPEAASTPPSPTRRCSSRPSSAWTSRCSARSRGLPPRPAATWTPRRDNAAEAGQSSSERQLRHPLGLPRTQTSSTAKSWGAIPYFGRWDDERPIREAVRAASWSTPRRWTLTPNSAYFSHCLPVRRNVKVSDERASTRRVRW
jgi:hypothetical protein